MIEIAVEPEFSLSEFFSSRDRELLEMWDSFPTSEKDRLKELFNALKKRRATNGNGDSGTPSGKALQGKQKHVKNEQRAVARFRENKASGFAETQEKLAYAYDFNKLRLRD